MESCWNDSRQVSTTREQGRSLSGHRVWSSDIPAAFKDPVPSHCFGNVLHRSCLLFFSCKTNKLSKKMQYRYYYTSQFLHVLHQSLRLEMAVPDQELLTPTLKLSFWFFFSFSTVINCILYFMNRTWNNLTYGFIAPRTSRTTTW